MPTNRPSRTIDSDDLDALVARTEGPQPGRRLFHATSGLVVVGLLAWLQPSWIQAVEALGAATLALFLVDALRLIFPPANRLFFRLLRPFASPREARRIASSTWYAMGVLMAVALFPRSIAIPAILVLALADPAANYAGTRWSGGREGAGTPIGSGAFFLVALLVLLPFVGVTTALLTALVATAVEAVPLPVDDNLVIPLATGIVLWSLFPLVS